MRLYFVSHERRLRHSLGPLRRSHPGLGGGNRPRPAAAGGRPARGPGRARRQDLQVQLRQPADLRPSQGPEPGARTPVPGGERPGRPLRPRLGTRGAGVAERGGRSRLSRTTASAAGQPHAAGADPVRRAGRPHGRGRSGPPAARDGGLSGQTLDRTLTCYRIGDPEGAWPIFDATGSRVAPGRWNTARTPLIYASEHYATAMLEKLANGSGDLPPDQHYIEITIDAGVSYETFSP